MPKSRITVQLPDEIIKQIEDQTDNKSRWVRNAVREKLNAEHDDLESLQDKVESIDKRLNAVESAIIQSTNQGRRGTAAGDHYEPTNTETDN